MNEAPKKLAELPPPPVVVPKPPIVTYSYTLGFTKGYKEGDSMIVGWAFGLCGVLAIIMTFMVIWSQISRLTDVLEKLQNGVLEKLNREKEQTPENKTLSSLLLPLFLTACLAGCAGKNSVQEPAPVVPMPPLSNVATVQAPTKTPPEKAAPATAGSAQEEGYTLTVHLPDDAAGSPRRGEPESAVFLLALPDVHGWLQPAAVFQNDA